MIPWFVHNKVAANLMMVIILCGGIMALPAIKKELFPSIRLDVIEIQVAWPGASPAVIEEGVCLRIEDSINDLDNIKKIESIAGSGHCTVYVTALENGSSDQLRTDIKARVDVIGNFPKEAEKPVVSSVVFHNRVIGVVVYGDTDEHTLTRLGERVRDNIVALPGINLVELQGARDRELAIEISSVDLQRYGITLGDAAEAIRQSSLDVPAGTIKSVAGDIQIGSKGRAHRAADFENITILTHPDGTRLRLGAIATIKDGFAEQDQIMRFDGQPAVFIDVKKTGNQDMIDITHNVRKYVDDAAQRMPAGTGITSWADDSVYLSGRISTLSRNAIGGLVLIFAVLALTLHLRLAFWVSVGTATAFLGALWLMPYLGISLNMLTMFAFILVLGIVVDDAIIIGESIFVRAERYQDGGATGAILGARLVAKPVIFSVLTTMIAFAPMLFFTGPIGNEIKAVPMLIIATLAFSLIECLLILPAHLSTLKPKVGRESKSIAEYSAHHLNRFVQKVYLPVLRTALRGSYTTIALFVAGLIITWSLVDSGWIRMRFEPNVPADWIQANVTLPEDATFDLTTRIQNRMEQAALELREELGSETGSKDELVIRHVGVETIENEITVFLEAAPAEIRNTPIADIASLWRQRIGEIPEAEKVKFHATLDDDSAGVELEISARELDTLRSAARAIKAKLASYDGVHDISDSLRAGKREIELHARPDSAVPDISLARLAGQVRQGIFGEEVQRIPRERDETRVMLRYPTAERDSITQLNNMRIRNEDGAEVPLHALAELRDTSRLPEIRRTDRRRSAVVSANLDAALVSADSIIEDLETSGFVQELEQSYPDLKFKTFGDLKERDTFMEELQRNSIIALLMIYCLMATAFKSYTQPLLIMTAIPFGFAGAAIGHLLLGLDLSMHSLLGMVAAAGVVINDNLVLVDGINRERGAGRSIVEAIQAAAANRFRPILLTSTTTFLGLLPMMLERSVQAQFLIPMAVSLAFGVLFATVMTLLLVPSAYHVLSDIKTALTRGDNTHVEAT